MTVIDPVVHLTQFGLSQQYFDEKLSVLRLAGFAEEDARKLRKSSKRTVKSVLDNYLKLLEAPYCFTYQEIVAIASQDDGSQSIKTIYSSMMTFIEKLQFTREQFFAVISQNNGGRGVQAIIAQLF